jgi:asparagine synthase (glutamine-hydrolysing)
MCGINGIVNFNNKNVNEDDIRQMMSLQKHRGPNDEGVFVENNVGLGFVRLSILDLTVAGHQPMESQNNRYVIAFNGEIFNYLELKKELEIKNYTFKTNTDTEVLLACYQEWGEDCLHKLNGMWAFAIYDKENQSLFAARDRYGIKPFYYIWCDDEFLFASELPPLLSQLKNKPTDNKQVIFEYLAYNRTDQTEQTFFKEIKKLQHGHCVSIKDGNVIIDKWYNIEERVKNAKPFQSADEFHDLFSDAIKIRLRSDVPVGVCLSGGLDSSAITAMLYKKFERKDLNTFSAVYQDGETGDEKEFIHEFKSELQNMHYITPTADTLMQDLNSFIETHAEPIPSTGPYAQYKVMELAQKHVIVTLDGQGADEMLSGYHYFFGFFFKDLLKRGKLVLLIREIIAYLKTHKSTYGLKTFIYFLLPSKLKTKARVKQRGYLNNDYVSAHGKGGSIVDNLYASKSLQQALINHFNYKLEHLLKWEDRNSMHFFIGGSCSVFRLQVS